MRKVWSNNDIAVLKKNSYLSLIELSHLLNRPIQSIENKAFRLGISIGIPKHNDYLGKLLKIKNLPTVEELITEYEKKTERYKIFQFFNTPKTKRITVAELHIPFHDKSVLKCMFKEDSNILLLIGDSVDFYGLSHFRKDRYIPLKTELANLAKFLLEATKRYEYVVMLEANHEQRFRKIILDKLKDYPEVIEAIGDKSIIKELSRLYKTVFTIPSWWCKIHKVIFAHPEFYSSVGMSGGAGGTVKSLYGAMIQLGEKDFQSIWCGHTHHQISFPFCRTYMYEIGIVCKKLDYILEGRSRNPEWHQGYGVCEIDKNGNFRPNHSKIVSLGWGD